MATNHDLGTDKFKPRGIPCVFLGYPSTQKGYKLLNLTTNKCFVSRDVTFMEYVFPFHPDSKSKYMSPIPSQIPLISTHNQWSDDILSSYDNNDWQQFIMMH